MGREVYINIKVVVELNVIRRNLDEIRSLTGGRVLFMVKADAYGHGMCEVAKAAQEHCDMFGVATVDEGCLLRRRGIKRDILVACASDEQLARAVENGLCIGVSGCEQMRELCRISDKTCGDYLGKVACFSLESGCNDCGKRPRVHLKIDTGMHRLGLEEDELPCILNLAMKHNIDVRGVYTHLRETNDEQFAAFGRACDIVGEYYPKAVRHIASSHSLDSEKMRFDMVRVGLSAYKNAMSVFSEVISSRYVRKGEYVGYGNFKLTHNANVAWVFGGYADGVSRENPSQVIIRGKKCRVLGSVCMDMFAVECEGFVPKIGEAVILQGGQMSVEEVAEQRKTIDYTAMTAWRGRVERIYFDDQRTSEEGFKG